MEMSACDAWFMDEAWMVLLTDETLTSANIDSVESTLLRVPGLALLGVLASSFWMALDPAEETSKRREFLLQFPG
jgi:hypothetical protein